ncbi:hypothetical protein H2203_004896 [Taxawa tesnikishii (nom. ined.)]|nr:hypothetical protein H2203_004896 [Dothideales sp. JES 119]
MTSPKPIWPNGATAAISVTMDNMGEAADIHRGIWPKDEPVGNHHSVRERLPKMLDLLDQKQLKATYFVESWNCDVYPDTIKHVQSRGHEIGWHAFQHEVWSQLSPEQERESFEKSFRNADKDTLKWMKERGMRYLSPAAEREALVQDVAIVPFRWQDIDAYYYMSSTAPLRKGRGTVKIRSMSRSLAEEGGYISLLFHPFLTTGEERMKVMSDVLDHVKSKKDKVWCAPCNDVSDWIHEHPESFGSDPGWDNAEWKKK